MTEPIRLLIADDQSMVRGALATLLELEDDFAVVAEAANGESALAACVAGGVDVALLDIEMPKRTGIEVAEVLHELGSRVRVLIVTTFGRPGYLQRAMAAGALGFVVKDAPVEELARAVRRVHRGERVIDPQLAAESLAIGASPLSDREREVLVAGTDGASVRILAQRLHLSEGTVRNHLSAAIGKVGVDNRAAAIHEARRRGWL